MRKQLISVVLIGIGMLMLTACGSAPDTQPLLEPLILPESTETYTSSTLIETGTLSLDIPQGWYREEQEGQLLIANEPLDQLEEDDPAIFISVLPINPDLLPETMTITTESLMNAATLTNVIDVVNSGTLTLDGREAAFTTGIYEDNEALVLSLQLEERLFVVVTAVSVLPINGDLRGAVEGVAASVRYTPDS